VQAADELAPVAVANVPTVQLVQAWAEADAVEKVPAAQPGQAATRPNPVENEPDAQPVQAEAEATLTYVPLPHSAHALRPTVEAYAPREQFVQAVAADADAKVPSPQNKHEADDVAPLADEKVPAAHVDAQAAVRPKADEKEPGLHKVHRLAVDCEAKLPPAHARHALCVVALAKVPAAHVKQTPAETAPTIVEKRPTPHVWHVVFADAAIAELNEPATHAVQADAPVCCDDV
jgi:hypothetical protein